MPYAASYSREPDLDDAIASVCDDVLAQLGGAAPSLSFLFVSHAHSQSWVDLPNRVVQRTGTKVLLGCTGETVVGADQEIESGPALSLWSAVLSADVTPFHAEFARTPDGIVCTGLPSDVELAGGRGAIFCFGEPYSSAPDSLIERFAMDYPGVPLLGGMASGGASRGDNRLFFGPRVIHTGAVGAIVHGDVRVRSVVSQGCRPVGTRFVVTGADRNVITELGGAPPLQRLQEMVPNLSARDQALVRRGLHVGIAMHEYGDHFQRGDFLIANVLGADGETGAVAIGNLVRVGQTIQFHVRDADTADEDLRHLLEADLAANPRRPGGALLFSCNGRGTRLFPQPNHDAMAIRQLAGAIPLAGFFAQGELGPVGGRNYIHGYTASIALFE